jgi:hypothetical protein
MAVFSACRRTLVQNMRSDPRPRHGLARSLLALALVSAYGGVMTGCASSVADRVPTAVGGLPEAAPARPETPYAYPAVHDMPPPRSETVLTSEQQKQVEDELVAARNKAASGSGSTGKATGTARSQ